MAKDLPEITFYDIEHTLTPFNRSWSPATCRTQLALRYRNLPFTRVAVSYPDIAGLLKSKDVPAATVGPEYTLPAIDVTTTITTTSAHSLESCDEEAEIAATEEEEEEGRSQEGGEEEDEDEEQEEEEKGSGSRNDSLTHEALITKTSTMTHTVMDSTPIALELDSLVPGSSTHPLLFPPFNSQEEAEGGKETTHALLKSINDAIATLKPILAKFLFPRCPDILDSRGQEYFHRTRTEWFGMSLEEYAADAPDSELHEKLCEAFQLLANVYVEEDGEKQQQEQGVFLRGRKDPCYADFAAVACMEWLRCVRGQDVVDKALAEVEGGRLLKVHEACRQWLY